MKKSILAILIALAALFAISCQDGPKSGDTSENAPSSDKTGEQAKEKEETGDGFANRQNIDDGIGEHDFGGAEFNVVLSTKQMQEPYFVEEQTGSIIDD
ncbi:MAG: hypothetical protein FWG34_09020, partial [Oscillospiraceae bacterium]|nr:hypothetical protein [Oscillospiraceae bacterium]